MHSFIHDSLLLKIEGFSLLRDFLFTNKKLTNNGYNTKSTTNLHT